MTPLIARQRYAAVVNGTGTASVYAFGECMKDLSPNDCNLCFAQCKTQVLKCLPFQLATRGGRVFYDGCYLRYDDYDFFNESLSSQDRTVCGSKDFGGNNTVFGANAIELVRNLSVQAVKNDGFFVGSVTFSKGNVSVHGLAQCWEFVNGGACENCLENAVSRIASCTQKEEGRVLNAGCYLRYSTQRFYNNSGPDPVPGNGGDFDFAFFFFLFPPFLGYHFDKCMTFLFEFIFKGYIYKKPVDKSEIKLANTPILIPKEPNPNLLRFIGFVLFLVTRYVKVNLIFCSSVFPRIYIIYSQLQVHFFLKIKWLKIYIL